MRAFVEEMEALSLEKSGAAHNLPVTVDAATGPVVAWYLRDFEQQTVIEGLTAPPATVAVVTLDVDEAPIGEAFRGRGFPLRSHWQPWGQWRQRLVRWLLFTEAEGPIIDQQVVIWVSNAPQ
jgi:hypothetical protein